ncbi:unnamed protein product, partial [Ectocarpus sp. 8 AP-2014]
QLCVESIKNSWQGRGEERSENKSKRAGGGLRLTTNLYANLRTTCCEESLEELVRRSPENKAPTGNRVTTVDVTPPAPIYLCRCSEVKNASRCDAIHFGGSPRGVIPD